MREKRVPQREVGRANYWLNRRLPPRPPPPPDPGRRERQRLGELDPTLARHTLRPIRPMAIKSRANIHTRGPRGRTTTPSRNRVTVERTVTRARANLNNTLQQTTLNTFTTNGGATPTLIPPATTTPTLSALPISNGTIMNGTILATPSAPPTSWTTPPLTENGVGPAKKKKKLGRLELEGARLQRNANQFIRLISRDPLNPRTHPTPPNNTHFTRPIFNNTSNRTMPTPPRPLPHTPPPEAALLLETPVFIPIPTVPSFPRPSPPPSFLTPSSLAPSSLTPSSLAPSSPHLHLDSESVRRRRRRSRVDSPSKKKEDAKKVFRDFQKMRDILTKSGVCKFSDFVHINAVEQLLIKLYNKTKANHTSDSDSDQPITPDLPTSQPITPDLPTPQPITDNVTHTSAEAVPQPIRDSGGLSQPIRELPRTIAQPISIPQPMPETVSQLNEATTLASQEMEVESCTDAKATLPQVVPPSNSANATPTPPPLPPQTPPPPTSTAPPNPTLTATTATPTATNEPPPPATPSTSRGLSSSTNEAIDSLLERLRMKSEEEGVIRIRPNTDLFSSSEDEDAGGVGSGGGSGAAYDETYARLVAMGFTPASEHRLRDIVNSCQGNLQLCIEHLISS